MNERSEKVERMRKRGSSCLNVSKEGREKKEARMDGKSKKDEEE